MKKFLKTAINILLSGTIIAGTFINTGTISSAEESQGQKIFIPFRSDLVKYVTSNAGNKDTIIQSQWFRLFKEETGTPNWSSTYYSDYTSSTGITLSSKNTQVTYNSSFDPFLYRTITSNSDFISNWINTIPTVFEGYCNGYKNHPVFCDGIVDLTKNGYMLGGGYKKSNNIFEYGFKNKDYWDLKVLAILSFKWNEISTTQKNWCKTYLPYLIPDYESRGASAIAAKNNNEALYNLMTISNEGFNSTKGQEFFSYANSNNEIRIGELFNNIFSANKKTGDIRTSDVYTEVNLNGIFGGDADCDYNGSSLGDGDYDWFAYNICFSGDGIWSRIRTFTDGDSAAAILKKEWLLRYYAKHSSTGATSNVANAIAKQGQTETIVCGSATMPGCNKAVWNPNKAGFNCPGHSTTGYATVQKPVGVEYISFTSKAKGYKWKIVDTATGTVISENMENYSVSPTIKLDAKYIWSSSISVYVESYFQKKGELIGVGACYSGEETTSVNWTYVVLNQCEVNGHDYQYSYHFDSTHQSCTAEGICRGCGDRKSFVDSSLSKTEDSSAYIYTADFAHTPVAPRSTRVEKSTGTYTYRASDKNAISGKTHDSQSVSKIYTGAGFTLHTSISGTCSLASGYIKPGAKSITISASGSKNTFTIYNKKGGAIKTITLISLYQGETKYTFDLSGCSDAELDGAYVVINMYSEDEYRSGMEIGQGAKSTSTINFNYITIKY